MRAPPNPDGQAEDAAGVLVSKVGRYEEAVPLPALRRHFGCAWTSWIGREAAGNITVVPDGCADLLWRDDRFTVVGPDRVAAHPTLTPGKAVLGLRFKPGAAAGWLGLPLSEIVGREIPMADLWGKAEANRYETEIGKAATPSQQLTALQRMASQRACGTESPHAAAAALHGLLAAAVDGEGPRAGTLHACLNLSERSLRRLSADHFGYGPKTLFRILRFRKFQRVAASGMEDGLAMMALRAGYADQAHLNREIQLLCGMTAGTFVRQIG